MGHEVDPSTETWTDTIAARATPPGVGAIGIVRMSGPGAWGVVGRVFRAEREDRRAAPLRPGRAYLGVITSKQAGIPIDQVLVVLSKAPRSYTGEDMAEIHCHGGPLVLGEVLDRVLGEGARIAEPGEFTRRAVLNGRLDLAQAEAVLDVIEARSPAGLAASLGQLRGGLSTELRRIRGEIEEARACLEAGVDFPEDGIQAEALGVVLPLAESARGALARLLATYRRGRVLKHGALAVLAGRPNVGKSSIFNRLLGRDRAIVTEHPGTTRDLIEEPILIAGIPFRLADSAGQTARGARDPVDAVAARIASVAATNADARIVVLDASQPLGEDDRLVLDSLAGLPGVLALNKCDLPAAMDQADEMEARRMARGREVVKVSALTGEGIEDLSLALAKVVESPAREAQAAPILQDERHHDLISKAAAALDRAVLGLGAGGSERPLDDEVVAVELREAAGMVAEVLGEGAGEGVLERVFRRFCVGK